MYHIPSWIFLNVLNYNFLQLASFREQEPKRNQVSTERDNIQETAGKHYKLNPIKQEYLGGGQMKICA